MLENALVDSRDIRITYNIFDADVVFIDYDAPHNEELLECIDEKEIFLYFASFDNGDSLETIASRIQTFQRRAKKFTLLVWQMAPILEKLEELYKFPVSDVKARFWCTPPRVTVEIAEKYKVKSIDEKTMDFVTVLDAADPKENAEMLCRAFLDAAGKFDDITTKLHIISPTELPFKPFNNISFLGLVPVPKMLRLIASSKYYISCSDKKGPPTRDLEACLLGIPTLFYSSKPEHEQTEESFSKKIEEAMLVTIGSPEYEAAIQKDIDNFSYEYLSYDWIVKLISIINEE
jgi:hypothetical protein